jgi:hypothetical protein
MNRNRAKNQANAKHPLKSMLERKEIAGFTLTLFFIVVVKTFVVLAKALFWLLRKAVNLVAATMHTTIFAVQLAVAQRRASQANDERTRWFGRATLMRAADIIVFARCWPLRPNTFVARRVLKAASAAAIIGLDSGDMSLEEAQTWLAQIKRQTLIRTTQSVQVQIHPLYVRRGLTQRRGPSTHAVTSSAGSEPPTPSFSSAAEMSLEDMNSEEAPDDVSLPIDEESEIIQHNQIAR